MDGVVALLKEKPPAASERVTPREKARVILWNDVWGLRLAKGCCRWWPFKVSPRCLSVPQLKPPSQLADHGHKQRQIRHSES